MEVQVCLISPKRLSNVRAVMMTAKAMDVSLLHVVTPKHSKDSVQNLADKYSLWCSIHSTDPMQRGDVDPHRVVVVDRYTNAQTMPEFEHPDDPIYVFGPEDGMAPRYDGCPVVQIPSDGFLNLAMAVGITLYDRRAKLQAGVPKLGQPGSA